MKTNLMTEKNYGYVYLSYVFISLGFCIVLFFSKYCVDIIQNYDSFLKTFRLDFQILGKIRIFTS